MAIEKVDSFIGCCDNCGDAYTDEHSGFSIFVDENSIEENMDADDWYTGVVDPDHAGKHYCPKCFKYHPEIDDKIIVIETRKKTSPIQSETEVSEG